MNYVDFETGEITYSDDVLYRDDGDSEFYFEYFDKKVEKIFNSPQLKEIEVKSDHILITAATKMLISEDGIVFAKYSQAITNEIENLTSRLDDRINFNLAFIECNTEDTAYLIIAKLNYKNALKTTKQDKVVKFATQPILPNPNTAVDEAIIIDCSNKKIFMIEKKVKIDGKPSYYLNNYYVKGEPGLTEKEKIKLTLRVIRKIHETDDYSSLYAKFNEQIIRLADKEDTVNIYELVKLVLNSNEEFDEAKELFKDLGVDSEERLNCCNVEQLSRFKFKIQDDVKIELDLYDFIEKNNIRTEQREGKTYLIFDDIGNIEVK